LHIHSVDSTLNSLYQVFSSSVPNSLLIYHCLSFIISLAFQENCDLDDQKIIALCGGLQACLALEELSLGE
jgi:hypothetical protein